MTPLKVFLVSLLSLSDLAAANPFPYPSATSTSTSPASSVLSLLGLNESVSSQGEANIGQVSFTCRVLDTLFPKNETFTTSSKYYTGLYEVPWSQTCWLTPACVVTPNNAQDLSKVIQVVTAMNTKFSVRSGGHTLLPGFNSIGSDGILIALQNLNKLSISSDAKTLAVGPGNRWGDVYNYAEGFNKTIVGGREPMVGVGGFLLGGGLTAFYNTVGLGFDNVVRYTVVLTDGSIVNATATQNADLFQALKGGMTNMGIVAEFELLTNDYNNIYVEIYLYNKTNTPALLNAYANYLANPNIDPLSQAAVQVTPNFTLGFYGYTGTANRPAMFDEFYKIPVTTTVSPPSNSTVHGLIFGFYSHQLSPGNVYSSSLSHKVSNNDTIFQASYQVYLDLLETLPPGVQFNYQPQGVSANLVEAGLQRNPLGNMFGLTAEPQSWVDISIGYADGSQRGKMQNVVDTWVNNITAQAKQQESFLPFQYPNNAAAQRVLKSYGGDGFHKIAAAAKKYDPLGVMQRLQGGGYLVSNE